MTPPIKREAMPAEQFEALARLAGIDQGSRVYELAYEFHVGRQGSRCIAKARGISSGAVESARERIDNELRWLVEKWDDIVMARGEVKKPEPPEPPPAVLLQTIWR